MGAIQKVNYEVGGQKVELTSATVRQYLVSGQGNVSDQEVGMFLKICEGQKLNPFLREAYLVKYGSSPASIIVGKDTFTKRAEASDNYKGTKSGVIIVNLSKQIENREGTFYLKGREELVGGWAKVTFKDEKEEVFNTVGLDEYIGKTKDGKITSMWATKPATMIRKVALVQALREAFPNVLSQMYTAEEMNIDEELPLDVVDPVEEQMKKEHVDAPPKLADKITKQQVMQLAKEKGLASGEGKEADIEGLNLLCKDNGMSLRALTQEQAESLIKILMEYKVIVEVKEEDIKPVEDKVIDAEIIEENTDAEPDPF